MKIISEHFNIDEVMSFVEANHLFSHSDATATDCLFHGYKTYMEFSACEVWKQNKNNLKCITCGTEAKYFKLHEHQMKDNTFYFQLYGINEFGGEVQFTKDHVMPKSLGGKNNISNYQVMCKICNGIKGNLLPTEYNIELAKILSMKTARDHSPIIIEKRKRHFPVLSMYDQRKDTNEIDLCIKELIAFSKASSFRLQLKFNFSRDYSKSKMRFQLKFLRRLKKAAWKFGCLNFSFSGLDRKHQANFFKKN